jgi:hypothetical protein
MATDRVPRREARLAVDRGAGHVLLEPDWEIVLRPPWMAPVRVVRPEDLLHLTFHFRNVAVESRGKHRVLVPAGGRGPSLLVLELPSQHITELALFEGSKGLPVASGRTGDPDEGRTDTPTLKPEEYPPVRSLIGGPSRLVFELRSEDEIEYTVEGLLEAATRLALRVGSNARPRKETPHIQVAPWWIEEVHLTEAFFRTPRLRVDRTRAAADVTTAIRQLRTTGVLAHRIGPHDTAKALAASNHATLFGNLRPELVAGPTTGAVLRVRPEPADPGDSLTGLELPWRLLVSPHGGAAWAHSAVPVEHAGRVELWHSRMGLRTTGPDGPIVDERTSTGRTIRAVWTRDTEWWKFDTPENLPPVDGSGDEPWFRMALNANDRFNFVHLTSDWRQTATLKNRRRVDYEPDPVDVNRLMVTSLGGWLDSYGHWDIRPDELSVEEWRHRAAMGRDHKVRVVRAGFLFPFGHKASLVKLTERKIANGTAYLFQRMFIVVRETTRTYGQQLKVDDPAQSARKNDRIDLQFPFKSVTFTTLVTPNLDEPKHLITGEGRTSGDTSLDAQLDDDWVFFPYVGETPFPFKAMAVDLDDRTVELATPILFVGATHNTKIDRLRAIARLYDADTKHGRTSAPLRGQRVTMATSDQPDDTAISVSTMTWGGDAPAGLGVGQIVPGFAPRVREASAVIPAVSRLAGNAGATRVTYGATFRKSGFDSNPGQVFLELPDKLAMAFAEQSDRSGGLVAPGLDVTALSRLTGPISGDPTTFANGSFNPVTFLQSAVPAKLFGVIDLWQLVEEVTGFGPDSLPKLPTFVSQALDAVGVLLADLQRFEQDLQALGSTANDVRNGATKLVGQIAAVIDPSTPDPSDIDSTATKLGSDIDLLIAALPGTSLDIGARQAADALLSRVNRALDTWATISGLLADLAQGLAVPEVVTASMRWRPELKDWPSASAPLFALHRNPDGTAKGGFVLAVDVQAPTTPGAQPSADVSCVLSEFDLRLLGEDPFLILDFEAIQFLARAGRKPEVDVRFRGVTFAGVLSFVETLKELIPLDGFSDPPSLDVSPEGITSSFSLAVPNIAVGVFSLENLSFGANLKIPFVGDSLEVQFLFCTREDPFRLIVSLFGGGGFFGVTMTPAGVKTLEAAFEFGAAVSLDFGVASGSLSVMAGIYFKMEMGPPENAALSGYFRARGEVDVLGIISASIELYLELTYEFPTGKATGRATLTIEIEVLFFSGSVEISCEKKFAGSNGDPTFEQTMAVGPPGNRPWDAYCQAFAEVA